MASIRASSDSSLWHAARRVAAVYFSTGFLSSSGFVFSNSIAFSSAIPAKRTSNRSDMIDDAAYFLSLFDSTSPGLAGMIPF
tara:strand:- start:82 stop:327 length:246 start_codon:yes stop_codon:yes gene_type:complete